MSNNINTPRKEPVERNPLVTLIEVLTTIDRRENIIDKEMLKKCSQKSAKSKLSQ